MCNGFILYPSPITTALIGQEGRLVSQSSTNGITLFMSSEDNNVTPKRRRRRKKVVNDIKGNSDEEKEESQDMDNDTEAVGYDEVAEASVGLQPRARAAVTLEVQDVRGLIAGPSSSKGTATTITESSYDSSAPMPSEESFQASTDRAASDDSFAQLLEDARRMKEDIGDSVDGEESLKVKARNILSTIVTADFFVVFGFLLWFLAGIGFRAVFNDDSVQIAFNSKISSRRNVN